MIEGKSEQQYNYSKVNSETDGTWFLTSFTLHIYMYIHRKMYPIVLPAKHHQESSFSISLIIHIFKADNSFFVLQKFYSRNKYTEI